MSIVDYLALANNPGANVELQAAYVADIGAGGVLENGYQAGLVESPRFNKTLRQSSVMTAAIANYISQKLAADVLDNGDVPALVLKLMNAIAQSVADGSSLSVRQFGALGNKVADDLAAFDLALVAANTFRLSLYIPGLPPGFYYRLSNVWTILNCDSIHIYGEGTSSLLFIDNAAGANCITVDSSEHVHIEKIGITGVAGSGHGIEWKNDSTYGRFENFWIGWVDGDGIRQTKAIGMRYVNGSVDQNSGYRPAGVAANGSIKNGLYIPYEPLGHNTLAACYGVHLNAVSTGAGNYNLKVGDNSGSVLGFRWHGDLIQGAAQGREVFLRTDDAVIDLPYVEPISGVIPNFVITMDRCRNTVVRGPGNVQGDIQMIGDCILCGVEKIVGCGVNISPTSKQCWVRDIQYANIITGPGAGQIIDQSAQADIRGLYNASNASLATGDNTSARAVQLYRADLDAWGGVGAPAGLTQTGGVLTRDAAFFHTQQHSAKMVMGADLTQFLSFACLPIERFAGRNVCVQAYAYNAATVGLAQIGGVTTGGASAGTVYEPSHAANTWERMLVTFNVPADATAFQINFTGLTGTVYWGDLIVKAE